MTLDRAALRSLRIAKVKADPRFLYVYSPNGTAQNERYVFTDHTCLTLVEALEYVADGGDTAGSEGD